MDIGGIVSAIMVGLVIGAAGRTIAPAGRDMSTRIAMVFGVWAALMGTVIAHIVGVAGVPGLRWAEILIQVLLAVLGVYLIADVGRRSAE